MSGDTRDRYWLDLAYSLAKSAGYIDEVPVGAIVVYHDSLIATGINLRESLQDPTSHAELIAIKKASKFFHSWRMPECTLYVTLEPCLMCAGLIQQVRFSRVVFGCRDPKGGALGSLYDLGSDNRLNHQFEVRGPVDQTYFGKQLSDFFRMKRSQKKASKES